MIEDYLLVRLNDNFLSTSLPLPSIHVDDLAFNAHVPLSPPTRVKLNILANRCERLALGYPAEPAG